MTGDQQDEGARKPPTDFGELSEARQKAQRLVDELEKRFVETEANPPRELRPDQLAMGRAAMTDAIASAKRALAEIDQAIELARRGQNA